MRKAFSLLELIIVILIISIIGIYVIKSFEKKHIHNASDRILLYLKQVRYKALIDSKEEINEDLWHKKRWTLKFLNCRKSVGGIYYIIYNDNNMTGQASLEESLNDPLTNKKVYSSNKCETSKNSSKYVLLTKEFGIKKVTVSCNKTTTIGQISFGNDGRVYSKLSNYSNEHDLNEIEDRCEIEFIDNSNKTEKLIIEVKTGYVYKMEE